MASRAQAREAPRGVYRRAGSGTLQRWPPAWQSTATSSRRWTASVSRATSSTRRESSSGSTPAAERLLGDVRGRQFTSVVAPEDTRRARELFSQKVLGTAPATDATGVLVSTAGAASRRWRSARCRSSSGGRVVGVFGLIERTPRRHTALRHTRISRRVRPRCCVFWSRAARRSRSPPSST